MGEEVNEKKMRRELIDIYQKFLKNRKREEAIDEAVRYDRRYGGLVSDHYIKYIPKDIAKAIGGLSTIYQYGMHPEDLGYSNEELIYTAKKILEDLKKEEK